VLLGFFCHAPELGGAPLAACMADVSKRTSVSTIVARRLRRISIGQVRSILNVSLHARQGNSLYAFCKLVCVCCVACCSDRAQAAN
jgi:hypothetical protein